VRDDHWSQQRNQPRVGRRAARRGRRRSWSAPGKAAPGDFGPRDRGRRRHLRARPGRHRARRSQARRAALSHHLRPDQDRRHRLRPHAAPRAARLPGVTATTMVGSQAGEDPGFGRRAVGDVVPDVLAPSPTSTRSTRRFPPGAPCRSNTRPTRWPSTQPLPPPRRPRRRRAPPPQHLIPTLTGAPDDRSRDGDCPRRP
jgi:hypothetical protein